MAAARMHCWECGTAFYGRVDARYCCGGCRQKAYRSRAARRAADETVPPPELSNARAQARQTREHARAARERAAALHRAAAQTVARAR